MARALWLADVLRGAGLAVREDAGWKTRGRDAFYPQGVVCHATAGGQKQTNDSAYSLLVNGRPGLSGPISQVMVERGTGVWRPVASGASNHVTTGKGGPFKGLHGNRELLGIEYHHDNLGEPWTEAALDGYARGVAAICRRLGIGVSKVVLHREHQPGEKSDTTFNGDIFRARVHGHLTNAGDDMQADERNWLLNIYNAIFFGGVSMGAAVPVKVNEASAGNATVDVLQHLRGAVDKLAGGQSTQLVTLTAEDRAALVAEMRGELGAVVREELRALRLVAEPEGT